MKPISFWVPATLCALISLMALFGSVIHESTWWRPTFYAFLPMCFFFVGSIMFRMHREMARLRHRVGRLEQRRQPGERPGAASHGRPDAQRPANAGARMEDGG